MISFLADFSAAVVTASLTDSFTTVVMMRTPKYIANANSAHPISTFRGKSLSREAGSSGVGSISERFQSLSATCPVALS